MKKISLLIVEDEQCIQDMLNFSLPRGIYEITPALSVSEAARLLMKNLPDLIVLDWMLPGKSGIDFIKWVKEKELYKNIPIIMLTANAEEAQKVQALLAGADDYLTKPFSPAELNARIKAILRRGLLISDKDEIVLGKFKLNIAKQTFSINEKCIQLMPLEYKLLHFFMTHPDRVYNRDQLLSHIWGMHTEVNDRTVDVQVKRLRSKLKPFGCHEQIKTIRGAGYLFVKNT